ncbi:putative mitochondrial large ribosomal subunit [Venustampulla echinocandica]|uniref:Putative mitochondrial large ribosomal subunit n=1 Tax=Venustampulla echinocandica TaxID=2656787 RepID=A0A370TQ05_9HELO|nr:putative mitochondrial large ribosomal subunit [Venustampulla echinocandica]RDL37615.1 putative mitochondrial large ribosomal subunit [Venustampulla echinocandica]
MSLNLPVRRAVRSATALTGSQRSPFLLPYLQRRTLFNFGITGWGSGRSQQLDQVVKPKNPLTEEYLRKKATPKGGSLVRGDLASSSIFEDEETAGPKPKSKGAGAPLQRNPETMAAALDPNPKARMRWERKMVIREIRKRGRLTRAQQIKRQERELLSKSHDFKTSVKKLVPLAHQIVGKTLEEAIVQMRFSKKKAAKDVKEHLEHAKNEAIVRRGMALGKVQGQEFTPRNIQTKDKKTVKVDDPTRLYIDQAWVGRGLYGKSLDIRARGRVFILKHPTTSISVILKEEKTRIRQHEERQTKIKNRKVWMQLPNRPVTAQRQFYSW